MKRTIAIICLLLFSGYSYATNYSSSEESFSGNDLTFIELEIPDSGTITDLNIQLDLDHGSSIGLYYLTIQLFSPYGNSVELGHGAHQGSSPYWVSEDGGNLYNTVLDDEATTSIYEGSPPFAGVYQPDGALSDFDGQSITGTWQLLITNSTNSIGTVEFTIMVETDSSSPLPYPEYGVPYTSTEETFTGNDLTVIDLEIPDSGTITDLNIQLDLDHGSSIGLYYLTIQLFSPYGNSVELGHGAHQGSSPYWVNENRGNLYNTVLDDEASISIYEGSPPFAGVYQPDGVLSDFYGQSMTGTWQLLITNSTNSSGTVEFTIMVETDSSSPLPYPDYGVPYRSTEETFNGNDLTFIGLEIPDSGTITDLNIQLDLDHGSSIGLYYLTIQLFSPYGNSVELGHGAHQGSSPYWVNENRGNLYNTVLDDEASIPIYDGSPPFAGAYQPDGTLSDFDGQSITGTWQLLITNSSSSGGTIEFTIFLNIEEELILEPAYIDFDNTLIGSDSTNVLKIINNTDSTVTINDITSTEACFTANWVSADSLISAGDSLMIDVIYTPDEIGSINAILTVENSDENKSINLSGFGLGANISSDIYSLNFGAIEPGYPDTLNLELTNSGNIDLEISSIIDAPDCYFNFISLTDSIIAPSGYAILSIEFDPQVEGMFSDSLFILSNAFNDDTLAISLCGEGGLTPAPVENLTINVDSVNVYLSWDEVTTTIHGNPLEVDCYLVYFEDNPEEDFDFLDFTSELNYTHNGVSYFGDQMFYQVTAYVGDMPALLKILAKYPDIKLGELERLSVVKQKLYENLYSD